MIIGYARRAKLVAMLASFFAGVDDWMKAMNHHKKLSPPGQLSVTR